MNLKTKHPNWVLKGIPQNSISKDSSQEILKRELPIKDGGCKNNAKAKENILPQVQKVGKEAIGWASLGEWWMTQCKISFLM